MKVVLNMNILKNNKIILSVSLKKEIEVLKNEYPYTIPAIARHCF